MKKVFFTLIFAFFFGGFSTLFAQKVAVDDIEIKFNPSGDMLIINVLDPECKEFDLFIYKTTEDVKVNTHSKENPIVIPIHDWKRGVYHIKIDYNYITQFRNVEIFE